MKKHFAGALLLSALVTAAGAQVTLDNFEAGVAGWTTGGLAGESATAYSTSGANSTANAMVLNDGGFSYHAEKTYPSSVIPANGNYKITFWYQNGQTGTPMRSCKVQVNGLDQFIVSGNPATAVTTWTQAETGVIALTTSDTIFLQVIASNGALTDYTMLLDEIILEPVTVVPITNKVRPLSTSYLAGTNTITVVPSGGSGTYTSVGFDINNDSTVDFTDSTSGDGFSYSWDTTGVADGAVPVRVITTDDGALTGETTVTYTVDNVGGRETLLSSDFEAFTSGVPDGWTAVYYNNLDPATSNGSPTAVISEETANPYAGAKSLHINYPSQPDPFRYTVLSAPFAGNRDHYQVSFAYRGGSFTRLAYFQSEDGISWKTSGHLFDPGAGSVWAESIDAPWEPGATRPMFYAIATHFYSTGDLYIDNVKVTASGPPPPDTAAANWSLYE